MSRRICVSIVAALCLCLGIVALAQDGGELPNGRPRGSIGTSVPTPVATSGHPRYWRVSVAQLAATSHSHACVLATVARVEHEADGDTHIRLEDGDAFAIAEVIPELPVKVPHVGARVEACGITRYDKAHRWQELHPCTSIRTLGAVGTGGSGVQPIAFIHPRAAIVLSAGPYGVDVPVQTRIPRDARNRAWLLAWNGENCGGSSARSLDGESAPTLLPESREKQLYQVHVGTGTCEFVAETHDSSGRVVSRGTFSLEVK